MSNNSNNNNNNNSNNNIDKDEAIIRAEIEAMRSDDLNISRDDIDFSGVDDDLLKFQKDELVSKALSEGVDLRQYSKQIEEELKKAEDSCVSDYLNENENLNNLHDEINMCDDILERMQHMLTNFKGNLGTISSEIKSLQDKSMAMNIQLKNRKDAEQRLNSFVQSIIVPADLVGHICDAPINETFIENLITLNNKIHVLQLQDIRDSRAARDVFPEIEKLRLKATQRIRSDLMERIYSLKKPNTNIQIKQDLLLKYSYFYEFLRDQSQLRFNNGNIGNETISSGVAHEIRQYYIDIVGKRYYSHFKKYLSNLKRLQTDYPFDKYDLLGTDESKTGGLFASRKTDQHLLRVFTLGARDDVLDQIGKDPILFHVAHKNNQKYPYEYLFRSAQYLLMDTATSEYAFLIEFFGSNDMFTQIFAKTISIFLEQLENYLFSCYDSIGILLMIRIVCKHNDIMRQRRVSCLDSYFDRVQNLLWSRFKRIFDDNLDSLNMVDPREVKKAEYQPRPVILRFASFLRAVLTLNKEYDDHIITSNFQRMRVQIERLLLSMSEFVAIPKLQMTFLINNYQVIVQELETAGLETAELERFRELRSQQIELFVEEELNEKFGRLVSFVKQTEYQISLQKAAESGNVKLDDQLVDQLVKQFSKNWRDGIEKTNQTVSSHFTLTTSGLRSDIAGAGVEILKQVLIQLVLYYQRFQDLLKKCYRVLPPFTKELVPIPTIMYEIKKYGKIKT